MQQSQIRYERVPIQNIYFKEYLCDSFKNSRYPMPENIRRARNNAIIVSMCELFLAIASLGFYARRRSRVILAIIIITIIATIVGFRAKLRLSYWGMLLHASYSISIIGGFFIYIVIDSLLVKEANDDGRISDTVIMLLLLIPMLGLFIMGIYSLYLVL